MSKLFIIGNGFDLSHGLPTRYSNFRDYLIFKYLCTSKSYKEYCEEQIGNDEEKEDEEFQESYLEDKKEKINSKNLFSEYILETGYLKEEYENKEIIFIVNELDLCEQEKKSKKNRKKLKKIINEEKEDNCLFESFQLWQNFEEYLGELYKVEDLFENITSNEEARMIEDENTDRFNKVKNILNDFYIEFKNWIESIDISKAEILDELKERISEDTLFLNFNYTTVLEEKYGVSPENVFHIHGKKGGVLIAGHGGLESLEEKEAKEKEEYIEDNESIRSNNGEIIYELDESLRKKTERIINKKEVKDFFEKIKNVDEIYSYGFSYAKVDEIYIKEIIKKINKKDITWYLNKYNHKINLNYKKIIEDLGFKGKIKEFPCNKKSPRAEV